MLKLTPRQQQVLGFIQQRIEQTGMPPTRADMCQYFGFKSPTAADDHLKALQRKGAIELLSGISRGIRVLYSEIEHKADGIALPLIGQVAAGAPILAEENIEEYLPVSNDMARTEGMFFLRVNGDSMINAAILDGDLVLVHPQPFVEQGEIAVVRIGDEATVKRFFRFSTRIELHPENPDFKPIVYWENDEDIRIVGKVTAVLRTL